MSVHENCSTCPVQPTCPESIKFYSVADGPKIMITGQPVVCPGPDRLTRIIDISGTRDFFGFTDPQKVLTQSEAARLRNAEIPALTIILKESRILDESVDEVLPTSELPALASVNS